MNLLKLSSVSFALLALTLATGLINASATKAETIVLQPAPGDDVSLGGSDYLETVINRRYVSTDAVIPLRQLLAIGPEYRGRRIQYVMMRASTDAGRGQARLVINGAQVGSVQIVGTDLSEYYFDPGFDAIEGDVVQTLQIHLNGNFTVETAGVQFYPIF